MDVRERIRYLIDNSAWSRLLDPSLPASRAQQIDLAFLADEVVACLPFLLEAGYSARSAREHANIVGYLGRLRRASIDEVVEERALAAQVQLARAAHHRLKLPDLLIATLADRHRLGVLHYDKDFDVILEHTTLSYESVWLAPQGSLA